MKYNAKYSYNNVRFDMYLVIYNFEHIFELSILCKDTMIDYLFVGFEWSWVRKG